MSDDAPIGNVVPESGAFNNDQVTSPDPATLIKAIATSGTDPMSVLLSQLQAQGSTNPTAALLASFLQMRKPGVDTESASQAEDLRLAEQEALAEQERDRSLQELNDTVAKLYSELERLRKRNDELAAAIGACFLCFGADPLCSECAGRGRPGAKIPEPIAYKKYVLPALRRVQKAQQMRADTASASGASDRSASAYTRAQPSG
jgi:hypothetical protein